MAHDGTSTIDLIGRALQKLNPTFVCLNEVDLRTHPTAIETITTFLSTRETYYSKFFGHFQGFYGNAIISRYPILAEKEIKLRGGSIVTFPSEVPRRIQRGMLRWVTAIGAIALTFYLAIRCEVLVPVHGSFLRLSIAATHLDFMNSKERIVQVKLEAMCGGGQHSLHRWSICTKTLRLVAVLRLSSVFSLSFPMERRVGKEDT